jgi:hypothetical protein
MADATKDVKRLLEKRENEPEEVEEKKPQEFEMTEIEFLRLENIVLKSRMMEVEIDKLRVEVLTGIRDRLQVPPEHRIAHNLEKKLIAILPPEGVKEEVKPDEQDEEQPGS